MFDETCKFNGNETGPSSEFPWPEKPTWNMTCDDTKSILLAKDELAVFKSFPRSKKDPLWGAWWGWDDVIFSAKCVAKYYHDEQDIIVERNQIAYGQVELNFLQ